MTGLSSFALSNTGACVSMGLVIIIFFPVLICIDKKVDNIVIGKSFPSKHIICHLIHRSEHSVLVGFQRDNVSFTVLFKIFMSEQSKLRNVSKDLPRWIPSEY